MTTIPDNTPQRQCTGPCNRILPLTPNYFYANKCKREGFEQRCIQCVRAQQKQYSADHAEAHCLKEKERRELDGGEPYRQHLRQYRKDNPEKVKQWEKNKYQKHKQAIQERDKKWRQTEAGRAYSRAYVHKRRAIHHEVEGHYTASDVKKQYANQKGRCYYCQKKTGKNYEVDHVIPLSRGGTNYPSNIVITCRSCNRIKSNKLPHEWPEGGRLL